MPLARLCLWFTSSVGLLVAAVALSGFPPPLAWTLAALGVHVTLATTAVFFPVLGIWGNALSRGRRGRRRIALTFDDGPDPATTPRVLSLLHEHDARATFFVVGHKVRAHPELARAIATAGHAIGLHGDEHAWSYSLRGARWLASDLERVAGAVRAATGRTPSLFRPPIGFVSHAVALAAEQKGLRLVGWTRRALDGRAAARPERVLARALDGLRDGAILLLHDASERGDRVPASLSVLGPLLDEVRRRGFSTVTVEELADDEGAGSTHATATTR